MSVINRIFERILSRIEARYRRETARALEEFGNRVRVPYRVNFSPPCTTATVWVEHEHLLEMMDSCRPSSFGLSAKLIADDCYHYWLQFDVGEGISVQCSWSASVYQPNGIPTGYRCSDDGFEWVRNVS